MDPILAWVILDWAQLLGGLLLLATIAAGAIVAGLHLLGCVG